MATVSEIVARLRTALEITEPTLDTSVGTTFRKMIDAFSAEIAAAYVDQYLIDYQYDLEAKVGADLDDFVRLFGFSRKAARRATGQITFSRSTPAPASVFIPAGTEVATTDEPPVVFHTVVPVILTKGGTSVEAPIQAIVGGVSGNAAPGAITRRVTTIEGIVSVGNVAATTGGTDAEGDAALRARFKATIFRSLAGTEHQFVGVAMEDDAVTRVNVVGSSKRRREQIQIVGGTATATVQDARYVYPNSSVLGPDIDAGNIKLAGTHYSFNTTVNPPSVTVLNATSVPDGIYDLEFDYVPLASRNDPGNGITNRIDVYVDGVRSTEAIETTTFRLSQTFNTITGDPLNRTNFLRSDGVTVPVAGNYFTPLAFAPVIDASTSNAITISGQTYVEGTDYWLVGDITSLGNTPSGLSGIEWKSAANGQTKPIPADQTAFSLTYAFNAVPRDVQRALEAWRLVGTDVRVHQAKVVSLNLHMAAILEPGVPSATVLDEMREVIRRLLADISFHGVVQVSDLIAAAHQVSGVDAIRFLHSGDHATNYGIRNAVTGYTYTTTGQNPNRPVDVLLTDDQVVALNDIFLTLKAENTFGAA